MGMTFLTDLQKESISENLYSETFKKRFRQIVNNDYFQMYVFPNMIYYLKYKKENESNFENKIVYKNGDFEYKIEGKINLIESDDKILIFLETQCKKKRKNK